MAESVGVAFLVAEHALFSRSPCTRLHVKLLLLPPADPLQKAPTAPVPNSRTTRQVKQIEGKSVRTENAKKRAQRLLKRGLLLSQSLAVPDEL
jgi:hypothetical protein